ncbi:hypothetical protein ACFFX1_19955 [Dactylosporangium sucinum]|uniref:Alpha/beta hydrolase n=1 Tax=Dactylosporangium sucinum TaxID=1424081 RepID=A0A917U198_9ACTN|nr:hypothetical protein [Dactylosporangium sucinum]GGM50355.1 hypothetical protein GCM10007977_060120 [Dactylosporangium sucinum]
MLGVAAALLATATIAPVHAAVAKDSDESVWLDGPPLEPGPVVVLEPGRTDSHKPMWIAPA